MHKKEKIYENHLNHPVISIQFKALVEYYQMSTHVPGFVIFRYLASFSMDQISPQQHKG